MQDSRISHRSGNGRKARYLPMQKSDAFGGRVRWRVSRSAAPKAARPLSSPFQPFRFRPKYDIQDALAVSRNLPLVHLLILPLGLCWEAINSFRIRGVPNAPPRFSRTDRTTSPRASRTMETQWYCIAPAVPVDHQSCEVHDREDYQRAAVHDRYQAGGRDRLHRSVQARRVQYGAALAIGIAVAKIP